MNENNESFYSFWEHVDELRAHLIKALWLLALFFIPFWLTYNSWVPYLTDWASELSKAPQWQLHNNGPGPLYLSLDGRQLELPAGASLSLDFVGSLQGSALYLFSPLEILSVSVRLSFWLAVWFCLPFWLWLCFTFIAPALQSQEKRWASPLLFVIATAWLSSSWLALPLSRLLLSSLISWIPQTVIPLWGLGAFVDFLLMVLLACASTSLLMALLWLLTLGGWISFEMLKNAQKGAILGSLILGAIFTPPDVLSQVALASVLISAYYLALALAWFKSKPKNRS